MNKTGNQRACLALILFGSMFVQAGDHDKITRSVIAGGGGQSTGAAISITSTIGQKEASTNITGGGYTLNGGFWTTTADNDIIFIDGFDGT